MDIFVGREEEQETIQLALADASDGTGQAVFVTGPPGIGKSYLVEHLFNEKEGVRFLQARCGEDDQPYEAIVKLLRKYMDIDRHKIYGKEAEMYDENAKKFKDISAQLSSPGEGSASGQQELFASIEDALFSVAKYIPLVIFVDNLHVADASSLEYFKFLSDSIDVLPILFVGAYRDEEVDGEGVLRVMSLRTEENMHNIPLEPLTALDVLEMVEKMLGVHDMPTLFIKRLYKETKGNPIFVREVVRTILEDKQIDRSDQYWYTKIDLGSIRLPRSLKEIILSQVKNLDHESTTVLTYGAALGEGFSGEVLERAVSMNNSISSNKVKNVLRSMASSKLLREEEGSYKFEYPELQQLLYDKIENKEGVHLALAQTLEIMDADVYIIAKQFSMGGDLERTWVYQEKAGDQAVLSMAPLDAMKNFSNALTALDKVTKGKKDKAALPEEHVRLLIKHGEVAHSLGEVEVALESFSEALKLAKQTKDDDLVAKTHRKIGDTHRTRSQWDEAWNEFKASLGIVKRSNDQHGLAETLRGMGYVHWRRGEFDDAISTYSDALKYAEATKDIPLVGVILIEFGNVYNEKGELDKALRYYLKSVDILTKTKEFSELARAYNNIGDTYLQMSQWKNAVAFFKKTGAVAEKIGNKAMMGWALFNASTALAKDGDPDKAINYAEGSLKILERIGDNIGLSGVYKGFGLAYAEKKDWKKAASSFKKSIEMAEEANSPYTLAEVYLETGIFYHQKGDKKKTKEYLNKAEKISKEIGAKVLIEKVAEEKKRKP